MADKDRVFIFDTTMRDGDGDGDGDGDDDGYFSKCHHHSL